MMYAEVFAGASLLWFFDLWALLVTFPLYFAHLLFFWTLAYKTNRTSFSSLYLFGVLFGMYESWITKVVWYGFMGQQPIMGRIFGFAILEAIIVVCFWHPIMSFILPLLTIEIIAADIGSGDYILPEHRYILQKTKRKNRFVYLLAFISATALSMNSGGNLLVSLSAVGGSVLLIYLMFTRLRKHPECLDIRNLVLGKKGFILVSIYLVALYVTMFFILLPERIPSATTLALTILFYIFVGILIYLDKKQIKKRSDISLAMEIYGIRDIKKFFKLFLIMLTMFSVTILIGLVVIIFSMFVLVIGLMILTGLTLFIGTIVEIIKARYSV